METTVRFNPDLGSMAWSTFIIEKVHRCADCPIRQMAVKRPHSVFSRIHRWHKTWWPGWKAQEARQCAHAAK